MASNEGSIEQITLVLARMLRPLEDKFTSDEIVPLFAELGLQFPPDLLNQAAFMTAIRNAGTQAAQLPVLIGQLTAAIDSENIGEIITKSRDLLSSATTLIDSFNTVAATLNGAAFPGISAADLTAFLNNLPKRLLDYLVITYLEDNVPASSELLQFWSVIERTEEQVGSIDPTKPPFTRRTLHLNRLLDLLRSPKALARQLYGWGDPTFDGQVMLERMYQLVLQGGLPAVFETNGVPKLNIFVLDVAPKTDVNPPGLIVTAQTPLAPQTQEFTEQDWKLRAIVDVDVPLSAQMIIQPNGAVTLIPPSGTIAGDLMIEWIGASPTPGQRYLVFGQAGGSRIDAASLRVAIGSTVAWHAATSRATGEPHIEAEIVDGKLVIDASKSEGVLSALTSGLRFEADFDTIIAWRPSTGVRFSGSVAFEIRLPVNFALGPVEVQTIFVRVGLTASGGLPLELSGTIRMTLGPVNITVDRVGLQALLSFPPRGNLGPANLDLQFKPPDGLGVLIDAGAISGGGFVQRQAGPPERYAGALALKLTTFGVVAFGIFERTPSGRIAFVVVLGIRFFPGIQLSFGFALTGVGGLIGINRRADTDALRERLVSGAAGNVLFAEDPIRNAPTLLGDLGLMFPAADGVYVLGPTLQISWLTFARLDLGIVIELPGPSRIVLLGVMRFVIGVEDSALTLIQIRLDILGIIDFVKKLVSFDAALVNSRMLQIFQLTGNAAFRLSTGDRPYVVLTIGGFHPAFNPEPVVLPPINRVALTYNMSQGVRIWMRLEAYLAITSNTFQVGARLELGIEAGPLNAVGFIGFDALIQFKPFYFEITFSAGFRVRWGSISLASVRVDGKLTGPGPIVISARLSIEILFFEVSWSDSFTLGDDGGDQVQPIGSVVQALTPELENPANLVATDSTDRQVAIVPKPTANKAVVAPQGQLIWSQKRAPLNVTLERLGGTPLAQPQAVEVVSSAANGAAQDWFSPGTYINLSQSEALNRAPFDRLDAGVRLGFQFKKSATVAHTITIETIRLPEENRFVLGFFLFPSLLLNAIAGRTAPGRVFDSAPIVGVRDEAWAVRNGSGGAIGTTFSQTEAHQQARMQGATALPVLDADDAIDLGGI